MKPLVRLNDEMIEQLKLLARENGVDFAALMTLTRSRTVVRARRRAWELLRTRAGYSYTEIGSLWGTDSSTICHGIRALHAA